MEGASITLFEHDDRVGAEVPGGRLAARIAEGHLRGRHAWSGLDDHALEAGSAAELYRDLYAVAGQAWIDLGALDHYLLAPAAGPVRDAWLGLSFFIQQVHGSRPLAPGAPPLPDPPGGGTIRIGGPDDAAVAATLELDLRERQVAAPCWAGGAAIPRPEAERGWREELAGDSGTLFLAEQDGEAVGLVFLEHPDPHTVNVAEAVVLPRLRGRGIGVALTEHALGWAAARGATTGTVDWRVANLAASRFWPARGFLPDHCRYVRYVRPAQGVWA